MSRNQPGPRIRVRANTQGVGQLTFTYVAAPGAAPSVSTLSHMITKNVDTMHDVVVADFQRRSAAGEIFNNPMSKIRSILDSGGGSFSFSHYTGATYDITGDGSLTQYALSTTASYPKSGSQPPPVSFDSQLIALLQQEALAKIDSTPFAFMEDTAELASTIKLLGSPLNSINNVVRSFEKDYIVRRKKGYPHAVALANAWLEARYAIRPALYTADNLVSAFLKGQLVKEPARRTARAKASETVTSAGSYSAQLSAGNPIWDFSWELDADRDLRVGILYEVTNPVDTIHESLGFRMKDVPVTVWNLVPYSWAVDRLVNISNFIKAGMNLADPRVRILAAWITDKTNETRKIRFTGYSVPGWTGSAYGDLGVTIDNVTTRTPWHPSSANLEPIFRPKIDAAFMADLASLALQRIRLGSFDTR